MKPLQERHEEGKSKLEMNILDLKRNYTEALEEGITMKSKKKCVRYHRGQLAKKLGS